MKIWYDYLNGVYYMKCLGKKNFALTELLVTHHN